MKSKADGWLFVVAVLAIAAVLFVPWPGERSTASLVESFRQVELPSVLAWLLASIAFWSFKLRFCPRDLRERRRVTNAVILILLQAVLLRVFFELVATYWVLPWPWAPTEAWIWTPWFLLPGLTGMLLGGRYGVLVCLTGGLMLYLLADPGPWPLVGCLSASLAGILFMRRSPTRGRVLRAGTATGGVLGMVAASQHAIQGAPIDSMGAAALVPLVMGLLSGFVVLALLPLLEWMLGELSDVSLIEYGTDHPLLDELRTRAPGTWHHSLNVADLAEKAASAIGARALFCKTSALYHDIGKLKEPALFAENNDGPSPHDQLDPLTSAKRIIEHVSYGQELARKHHLPKPFREIIAEHHGVSVVRFFYAKACGPRPDAAPPTVNRASFCYPGPAPSTRESGIIALADAVEAASRTHSSRLEHTLRQFVRQLLADRIAEGELAQCPLTLADLAKIEAAFVGWLKGRNHYRPAYPDTSSGLSLRGHESALEDTSVLRQLA